MLKETKPKKKLSMILSPGQLLLAPYDPTDSPHHIQSPHQPDTLTTRDTGSRRSFGEVVEILALVRGGFSSAAFRHQWRLRLWST